MHIFPFVAFSVLFFVFYCLNYCVFSVALQDDVEFCKGKKRVKSRKKQKGFWKKFLFLDIRKEVILWHYLLFWVNLGAFVTAYAAMLAFFIHESTIVTSVFLTACAVVFLTLGVACYIRWPLYTREKGNDTCYESQRKEMGRRNCRRGAVKHYIWCWPFHC